MTIARIIETIINTKTIHESSYVGGMARLARDGERLAIRDLKAWWVGQGGTVA